jgi:hypothetical protein
MAKTPIMVGRPSDIVDPQPVTETPATPGAEPQVRAKAPETRSYMVVHHIVRTLSKDGSRSGGSVTSDDMEEYLLSYFRTGWYLFNVIFVDNVPEGHTFCWVIAKNP